MSGLNMHRDASAACDTWWIILSWSLVKLSKLHEERQRNSVLRSECPPLWPPRYRLITARFSVQWSVLSESIYRWHAFLVSHFPLWQKSFSQNNKAKLVILRQSSFNYCLIIFGLIFNCSNHFSFNLFINLLFFRAVLFITLHLQLSININNQY